MLSILYKSPVILIFLFFSCGTEQNQLDRRLSQRAGADHNSRDQEIERSGKDQKIDFPLEEDPVFNLGLEPDSYLDLDEIAALAKDWAEKAPHLVSYETYGDLAGLPLAYIRISREVSRPDLKLAPVLLAAGVHGDEAIGVATLLGVAQRLISATQREGFERELVNSRDIYIVPVTCPDGYSRDSRTVEGGIDPNRSYPWPGDVNADSAQCVSALRDLFEEKQFLATMDIHASGRMWLIPWGYTTAVFDEEGFGGVVRSLTKELASLNSYIWGQIPDMVGYTASGSSADYFYLRGKELGLGTLALGVETGTSKRPASSAIKAEVDLNEKAFKLFIKEGPLAFQKSQTYTKGDEAFKAGPALPIYESLSPWFVPGEE